MSEVVWVAVITGGLGLTGTITTGVVALKTSAQQRDADAARLRDRHREDDRRVRRDTTPTSS